MNRDSFFFPLLLLIASLILSTSASSETSLPSGTDRIELVLPQEGLQRGEQLLTVEQLPRLGGANIGENTSLHPGFPVFLNPPATGQPYTPTLYDIDGDKADEIFVTGQRTFGIKGDGTFLPGWPTNEQEYAGYGTSGNLPGPSAADFEPGGTGEVLWTTRDWWAGSARLWTFNGRRADGTDLPGFPQQAPDTPSIALRTPFVLGDTDDDGNLEAWGVHTLGNTDYDCRISALDASGNLIFTVDLDPSESVLSLHYGDLNGDGSKEMFATTLFGPSVWLYAFGGEGSIVDGYPVALYTPSVPTFTTLGPPVPLDLDHDGDLEVLAGYFDPDSYLDCFHHDGSRCSGYPLLAGHRSQPLSFSIGDVNGDHDPELVLTQKDLVSGNYAVFVIDLATRTPRPGWPQHLPAPPRGLPAVADVTGDGVQDILIVTSAGSVSALNGSGGLIAGYPKQMISASISGVAVGDIDGDRFFEIVAATWDGWIYAWDTDGRSDYGLADWPMRGVNSRNTGVFGDLNHSIFAEGFESGDTSGWSKARP